MYSEAVVSHKVFRKILIKLAAVAGLLKANVCGFREAGRSHPSPVNAPKCKMTQTDL